MRQRTVDILLGKSKLTVRGDLWVRRRGVWNVLGDHTRRAILEWLAERPLAVVDLAERLPVSRPAVSQHLKVLKDSGLVSGTRSGGGTSTG